MLVLGGIGGEKDGDVDVAVCKSEFRIDFGMKSGGSGASVSVDETDVSPAT